MIATIQEHGLKWTAGALGLVLMAGLVGGCSTFRPLVPLFGSEEDLAVLEGEWVGEYSSVDSGRRGTIVFMLSAEADSAYGDVMMYPRILDDPYLDDPYSMGPSSQAQQLRISFVQCVEGRVRGSLERYRDPDCGCTLDTVFEGTIKGDRIEGTYTSRGVEYGLKNEGTWYVTRRKTTDRPTQPASAER